MIFETVTTTGGCRSYVIGCEATCAAALVDPELGQIDRYIALAARDGYPLARSGSVKSCDSCRRVC